ncbi:MAG: ABC transporter permease [Alphaproteobacteria bacterium]|nr:ABC transporter permease [Alphaproteobacteria bacterium]
MTSRLGFFALRIAQAVPAIGGIATLNFLLLHMAPGDAADIIVASSGHGSPELVAELRRSYGLDQPLHVQFLVYVGRLLTLDLGTSLVLNRPVVELIGERLGATLILMLTSIGIAVAVGLVLGIVAAMRHRGWTDAFVSIAALIVYATPQFWLGLMLIVFFSITLDLFPSGGMRTIGVELGPLASTLDVARHLVLPATTLGLFYVAVYTRLMRTSMLDIMTLDYIKTARAKGLSELRIAFTHAARNALLPVVTLMGVQIGHLLGGSILVETVFGWPGLGRLVLDALLQRDLVLLLGILFVSSSVVVLTNLAVDLLYGMLDPRLATR